MSVDEVYSLMQYICNKNQQGIFTPDNFFTVINQAQKSYQAYLLGEFQTYTPGRPVAKVELGQNSVVRQRLSPTIYGYVLNVNTNGNSFYPADYIQTDSMYSIYGNKRIRNVQQNALDSNINSVIDPVASNPIYLIEDIGFQFYPTTVQQAKLTYVRDAPDIVWGFDLDTNGLPVYNPSKSVDPIWDNISISEIISRALLLVGINLQAPAVIQLANEQKNGGQ